MMVLSGFVRKHGFRPKRQVSVLLTKYLLLARGAVLADVGVPVSAVSGHYRDIVVLS